MSSADEPGSGRGVSATPTAPASIHSRTADVPPLQGTIRQDRSLDAIDFGLEVATPGYNLFPAGAAGSGRESTILGCLERAPAQATGARTWESVYLACLGLAIEGLAPAGLRANVSEGPGDLRSRRP